MSRVDLQRLIRTDRHELRHRAGVAARQARDRARLMLRPAKWERSGIRRVLSTEFQTFAGLSSLIERQDWRAAHARISDHFSRQRTNFLHGLRSVDDTRPSILERFPRAMEESRATADRLIGGTIDVLGHRALSMRDAGTGEIDWQRDPAHDMRPPLRFWSAIPYLDPALGDHKVIWEINRHQHWLALGRAAWLTGDDRYSSEIVGQLGSWLRQNPPLVGINWASMLELAFRSISWVAALAFCTGLPPRSPEPWSVDLLLGLDAQLEHVRRNLSRYFSPNTHLLGEALGLYVGGRSIPELANARRWADVGREVLLEERTRQVNPDGGHAELSPHYHRYALDFYLLALAVARVSSDAVAQGAFEKTAGKLAGYMRAICDDRGRMPLIGDDDGGQTFPICGNEPWNAAPSLACAAVLLNEPQLAVDHLTEETIWLAGPRARMSQILPSPAPTLRDARVSTVTFPDTGYRIGRTSQGDHLVFDAGPHGFLNGGHAHADALQVVFTSRGRPLLIDPGTSTYTMSASVRDRFRSTRMHNTVLVDGRAQSEPAGPFHWHTRTDSSAWFEASAPRAAWFEAQHEGYAPVIHRRGVLLLGDGLCVVLDRLIGDDDASHEAAVNWHLAPEWTPESVTDRAVRLTTADGGDCHVIVTAEPTVMRGEQEGVGWCAPIYGQLIPTSTITAKVSGACPLAIATAIVPERERCARLLIHLVEREHDIGTVVDIEKDSGALRLISWTERRGRAQSRIAPWTVAGVSGDARVVVLDRRTAEPAVVCAFGDSDVDVASAVHAEAP